MYEVLHYSWAVVLATCVAGCATAASAPGWQASEPVTTNDSRNRGTELEPTLAPLVDFAVEDLARRLNIERSAIAVMETRRVVWPDGSLGCPRPGMVYPQIQQDGLLIRLRARDREFWYHSGGIRKPFLCEGAA